MPLESQSDEELMSLAQAGQDQAFEVLAQRLMPKLMSFILRHVGQKQSAEDLLQETLLRAYKHRMGFRAGCRVSTWVFTLALNLCRDHHRRQRPTASMDVEAVAMVAERQAQKPAGPEERAARQEEAGLLVEALQELPELSREVLRLRTQEGLSYDRLAPQVGLSAVAARTTASRAIKRLKELLEARNRRPLP